MPWSAWVNITANDYMDISYISQVNENILHVGDLITKYLLGKPRYRNIPTNLGYQTQPTAEYLNRVEGNLNYLQQRITWDVKRQPSRTWLGENKDTPTFDYSDVNRWFSDLLIMKLALDSIPFGWRICGTFSCGNNNSVQKFRR